jgi:hypothetical protein
MKKFLVPVLVIACIIAVVSCTKKTSPSGPSPVSGTATITPTYTQHGTATISPTATITATVTISPTNSPTPDVAISAFVNGTNSMINYWITLSVNGSTYQYATITVSYSAYQDVLVYNGSTAYTQSGSTAAYIAGEQYLVLIQTEYGIYSGMIQGPGGNVSVGADNSVSYAFDGTDDFVQVHDSGNTLMYNSQSYYSDIAPGFVIPGTAFPSPGSYDVWLYPKSILYNRFTGGTIPSLGTMMVEGYADIPVTR